jgi:hypothetical protein
MMRDEIKRVYAAGFASAALVAVLVISQAVGASGGAGLIASTTPPNPSSATNLSKASQLPLSTNAIRNLTWEQDHRATQDASGAGQQEPAIAANPLNLDNAVVVAKDYRSGVSRNYIDTTTDGGVTWLEQPFPRPNPDLPSDIDPAVFFRPDGRAYITWTSFSDFGHGGLFCSWSDDGGLTWSTALPITPADGHFDDKPWLAFDTTGGPHSGTIYAAWTRFGNAELAFARSTDGGATWSTPIFASNGSSAINNDGAQPLVLPDGTLLIMFLHNTSPGIVGTLTLAVSTDGGATFLPNTPLFDVQQAPYTLPGEQWRNFTYHSLVYDRPRGWLHVIWPDYRDNTTEGVNILYSRSTDTGATWSNPARLNDDPPGIVRDQWFPALCAAPDGRLTALWLDRRESTTNTLYHAYSRFSTDGGISWSPGARVSTAPSDPNMAIPTGSDGMGDYIGISTGMSEAGVVVWGAWTDVRNGNQDIYAAREQFVPLQTPTPTPALAATATGSPTPTHTSIPTATGVAESTATVTASPTPCAIAFSDVQPSDYFYEPVRYLYCRGVVSGYDDDTFRPYNQTTRSQTVKIVTLAEGWALVDPSTPTFADVPYGSTFYNYVETAYAHSILGGYPCGGEGEPCDDTDRPYFRPYAEVTRGQVAKLVTLARGWALSDPDEPTFSDVPHGSTFYVYIETASQHGVIGGYPCGAEGEPCDEQDRPYFRPFNNATRGQIAKIVYLAVIDQSTK